MIYFPKPLIAGNSIAITAPSSGVSGVALDRLDLVLNNLRSLGYQVIEGSCLRNEYKDASSSTLARAEEFNAFLNDSAISAIFPPWGGELATELLDLIDFELLRAVEPKWFLGYSDLSTLHLPLTLISGWATAHGPNLMDLAPTQSDPLTTSTLSILESTWDEPVIQHSSTCFQTVYTPYESQIDAPFNLSSTTRWWRLDGVEEAIDFQGRLIGGCLDTIGWLAGTPFGDMPSFISRFSADGTVLYLENAAMEPPRLVRCLQSLRRKGWFQGLSGILMGRNAAPEPNDANRLKYLEAIRSILSDLTCPVLMDIDIGHLPPQLTLINGAYAQIRFYEAGGSILQSALNNCLHLDT